jgi:hypothetical protein
MPLVARTNGKSGGASALIPGQGVPSLCLGPDALEPKQVKYKRFAR